MRIHPGLSLITTLACATLLEAFLPASIPTSLLPRIVLAGLAFIAGSVLMFWAIHTLQSVDTSLEPHREPSVIVTTGPFRFSRNPMYLANLLMCAGFVCITASAWFLIGMAIQFSVLNLSVIPAEEESLKRSFPTVSASWFSATRRWL